jgi:hypothetical protein
MSQSSQEVLDDCKTLRIILRRMKIKPRHTHESWRGDKRDIYGTGWGFLWLPIYIIGIGLTAYDLTLAHFFKALDDKAEQRKKYITLQDIYTFKKGDKILMKDGKYQTLLTFTADSFSNDEKEVFPWIAAKENTSANFRNKNEQKHEKFTIFEKEAKAFEKRVAEFNKAFESAKKESF